MTGTSRHSITAPGFSFCKELGSAIPPDLLTRQPEPGTHCGTHATCTPLPLQPCAGPRPRDSSGHPAGADGPSQATGRCCLQRLWRLLRRRALPAGPLAQSPAAGALQGSAVGCPGLPLPMHGTHPAPSMVALAADTLGPVAGAALDRRRLGLRLQPSSGLKRRTGPTWHFPVERGACLRLGSRVSTLPPEGQDP